MIKQFLPQEKIIGFYENLMVNQMKEEGALSNESSYICEIIKKNCKLNPILFQIYSKDSGQSDKGFLTDNIFYKQFVLNEDNFSFVDNKKESDEEFKAMKNYCLNNRQLEIIDFDEHLENPDLDWRNDFIN